jgi:hypothetical protein
LSFGESIVESAALTWVESFDWTVQHGPEIAPVALAAEVQACLARSSAEEIWR